MSLHSQYSSEVPPTPMNTITSQRSIVSAGGLPDFVQTRFRQDRPSSHQAFPLQHLQSHHFTSVDSQTSKGDEGKVKSNFVRSSTNASAPGGSQEGDSVEFRELDPRIGSFKSRNSGLYVQQSRFKDPLNISEDEAWRLHNMAAAATNTDVYQRSFTAEKENNNYG